MLTLGTIYMERHPGAAPAMFKYIKTVRDMATRGGNWSFYDTQFHKQKVRFHWQWDFIHWELHFNAITKPVTKSPFVPMERNATQKKMLLQPFHVPRCFCWGYDKTGKWPTQPHIASNVSIFNAEQSTHLADVPSKNVTENQTPQSLPSPVNVPRLKRLLTRYDIQRANFLI